MVPILVGRLCAAPSRARVQRNGDGADTNASAGSSLERNGVARKNATSATAQTPLASAVKKNSKSGGQDLQHNNARKTKTKGDARRRTLKPADIPRIAGSDKAQRVPHSRQGSSPDHAARHKTRPRQMAPPQSVQPLRRPAHPRATPQLDTTHRSIGRNMPPSPSPSRPQTPMSKRRQLPIGNSPSSRRPTRARSLARSCTEPRSAKSRRPAARPSVKPTHFG